MNVTIIGWYGVGNTGDEAILFNIIESLVKRDNSTKISVPSFNPEKTKELLSKHENNIKHVPLLGNKLKIVKTEFTQIFRVIKGSDYVLIGGGGMLQDAYNWYTIPYFALFSLLAKALNKKTIFFNVGVGPVRLGYSRKILNYLCKTMDLMIVRDQGSYDKLKNISPHTQNIILGSDPVFYHNKENNKPRNPYIAVSLRDVQQWHKLNSKSIASILDEVAKILDTDIMLIPFGSYTNQTFGSITEPEDATVAKNVLSHLDNPKITFLDSYNLIDITKAINGAEILIGMRLHSLIIAATQNTPTIAVVYKQDDKLTRLYHQIDLDEYTITLNRLSSNNLLNLIDRIHSRKNKIKQHLSTQVEINKGRYLKSLNYIFNDNSAIKVNYVRITQAIVYILLGGIATLIISLINQSRTYYIKKHE